MAIRAFAALVKRNHAAHFETFMSEVKNSCPQFNIPRMTPKNRKREIYLHKLKIDVRDCGGLLSNTKNFSRQLRVPFPKTENLQKFIT